MLRRKLIASVPILTGILPKWLAQAPIMPGTLRPGAAQPNSATPTKNDAVEEGDFVERSRTFRILAPTVVVDKKTKEYVLDLKPSDFRLLDNGIEQERLTEDLQELPISLVLVVQKSADLEAFLPNVQKAASLISAALIGDQGEAAVIAFDNRIRVLTDFTRDAGVFKDSLKGLTPGSDWKHQIDAVQTAIRMLKRRDNNRKKVILLISEEKDKGSEARTKDTLRDLEFSNITVYAFNVSQLVRTLTAKPGYPPPTSTGPVRMDPMGRPMDPVTSQQMYGWGGSGNAVPLIRQVFESAKDIFVSTHSELWTKYTGGRTYGFKNLRDLEAVIQRLEGDLNGQYLLSYEPNAKTQEEGGWHTIEVVVKRPNMEVRTRPGYWAAARFQ
jgi:VWFA-related protein